MSVYTYFYSRQFIDTNVFKFAVNLRYNLIWLFFSLSWIIIFEGLFYLSKNKHKLFVYNFLSILWTVVFVVQICYCDELGKFMIFSDIFVAGEGLQYVKQVLLNLDLGMVIVAIFNICCTIAVNKLLHKDLKVKEDSKSKLAIFLLIVFALSFRLVAFISLGRANNNPNFENLWEENYNAKDIYKKFINPNTSMYVSGLYEYDLRAVYKYYYNLITIDKDVLKEEIDLYNSLYNKEVNPNEYTGIFKDKNVIYVLMESIDSWIIDDTTMPTLSKIRREGLNFTNRYSPFFNGGQTINSEFAVNSGLYSITDYDTIYDIKTVNYKYSLANMFKKAGYKVNSFHANTGTFYNRSSFHKLLGYDNHYSALDLQEEGKLNKETNYFMDSSLISDDKLSKLIFGDKSKFLSFITTYSAHLEYSKTNKIFKTLDGALENTYPFEEEYIYRTLATDTDKFLEILLEKLEDYNRLDDTVIVLVSDHYSYGYSDINYVAEKKNVPYVDGRYLQNTPFIIWSKDIEHKDIDTILDTADILPTVLNMFGIKYDVNKYMGDDVFSSDHDNFVWFSDASIISSGKGKYTKDQMYAKANLNIIKNRNILLTNYYGK